MIGNHILLGISAMFEKLLSSLKKTTDFFQHSLKDFSSFLTSSTLSSDQKQSLEDALILADIHIDLAEKITQNFARKRMRFQKMTETEILQLLADEMVLLIGNKPTLPILLPHDNTSNNNMRVSVFVGVNGSGKTTAIGKLAYLAKHQGDQVMLAAGDTFRAAASQQLQEWAARSDVLFHCKEEGSDPASLVYEAIQKANEHNVNRLFIDTAGRLQNKQGLMQELEKINRVIIKQISRNPDDVILVLDAQNGQNVINQFKEFQQILPLTAIMMNKLDGTAKGGTLLNILYHHDIPVMALGIGEKIDDIIPFNHKEYINALLGIQKITS